MKASFLKKLILPIVLLSVNVYSVDEARAQEGNSPGRGSVRCYRDDNNNRKRDWWEDWDWTSSSTCISKPDPWRIDWSRR